MHSLFLAPSPFLNLTRPLASVLLATLLLFLFYAKIVCMNIINLYDKYNSYFNADLKAIFEHCSKIAAKHNFKMYLIGGMVRDLLVTTLAGANEIASCEQSKHNQQSLSRNDADIDITVEGNAIEFAHILKKELDAKILSVHESFGTAKIEINRQKMDLASTRSESYPKAGHLPHVDKIGCPLKEDVIRRDFTINALALSLNQESFADLIDYTGGFKDLKTKKIKVLHDKSFIDDPTRIIRALKYSSRLNFELDEKTLKLQENYLQNINYDMCYKRIKQEIKKTFEQNSQVAFEKFIEQKIYKLITPHPSFAHPLPQGERELEKLIKKYQPKHPWLVYFGVLAVELNIELSPTNYEKEVIEGAQSLLNQNFKDDFELYKALRPQKLETLLILAALGKEKEVYHYLDNLANIQLHINGNDLIELGFKPSKKFLEVFDYVLKEKLKNPKMTKLDEIALAGNFLINNKC